MKRSEFIKGTIELVILSWLKDEDMYGYQMMQKLKEEATNVLAIKEGTLYPILQRMQDDGWIAGRWTKVGEKRKRHMYGITAKGRGQLKEGRELWMEMTQSVNRVMRATA